MAQEIIEPIEGYIELYRSGIIFKGWRWRFVANNGRVIYATTESYKNKNDAIRTMPIFPGNHGPAWREYDVQ